MVLKTLPGHARAVYGLALTPDGKELVSGDGGGTLKIWPLSSEGEFDREKITPASLGLALPFFLRALQARNWEDFRAAAGEGFGFFR